jgi:hypothetical protein
VRRLAPSGLEAWAQVIERGYEGLVAKDETSAYEGGPTRRWLQVKRRTGPSPRTAGGGGSARRRRALVAPVPRQEDVGNDAFATLIRPEGSRRLISDVSFMVQPKAASYASLRYETPDDMAWVSALDSPLVIGRVYRKQAKIELFTTLRCTRSCLSAATTRSSCCSTRRMKPRPCRM